MKKFVTFFVLLFMFAYAEPLQIENGIVIGFSQSLSENERPSNLVIPSEAFGQPVIAIGAKAFFNSGLTSVTIPESIISIGEMAFAENQLTKITIPSSVRTIEADAFDYSEVIKYDSQGRRKQFIEYNKITEITIGANVNLSEDVFYNSERFNEAYKKYNHSAGTYIYTNSSWDKTEATKTNEEKNEEANAWHKYNGIALGAFFMLNSIVTDKILYKESGQISIIFEYYKPKYKFFSIGWNFSYGHYDIDKDYIREIHPDADKLYSYGLLFNLGSFAKLYPVDFAYMHGGAALGYYGSYNGKTNSGDEIKGTTTKTVTFPVGAGFIFGTYLGLDFYFETLYNIAPFTNPSGGYLLYSLGLKWDLGRIWD